MQHKVIQLKNVIIRLHIPCTATIVLEPFIDKLAAVEVNTEMALRFNFGN